MGIRVTVGATVIGGVAVAGREGMRMAVGRGVLVGVKVGTGERVGVGTGTGGSKSDTTNAAKMEKVMNANVPTRIRCQRATVFLLTRSGCHGVIIPPSTRARKGRKHKQHKQTAQTPPPYPPTLSFQHAQDSHLQNHIGASTSWRKGQTLEALACDTAKFRIHSIMSFALHSGLVGSRAESMIGQTLCASLPDRKRKARKT